MRLISTMRLIRPWPAPSAGVCLAGKYELYGELLVVDNLGKTVEVGEEQVCAFVGGESTGETDDKGVGVDAVYDVHHSRWITLVGKPFLFEVAAYEVDELVFELHAHVPDLLVGNIEDAFPCFGVALMFEYLCAEFVGVEFLSIRMQPR